MAMTLRPDEQLAEALRLQAEIEGRSQSAVVLDAVREYVERRAHQNRVSRVLDRVIAEEMTVLRRLGSI